MGTDQWQEDVGSWGNETFPSATPQTIIAHLREEIAELAAEIFITPPGSDISCVVEESADCFLLLLHLAHRYGFSLQQASQDKMARNRRRRWSASPEPEGHFKHVAEAVADGA